MPRFQEEKPHPKGHWAGEWDQEWEKYFSSFNIASLGLGQSLQDNPPIPTLAVLFDLEGFTRFCEQSGYEMAVPEYMRHFIPWLVLQVKNRAIGRNIPITEKTGHMEYPFPYFMKFTGDGILFLWNADNLHALIANVVEDMYGILEDHNTQFYKTMLKRSALAPTKLRCGIARGSCLPIGNKEDYVGACINLAARLQKLPGITFAIRRLGVFLKRPKNDDMVLALRCYPIKGSHKEMIYILERELDVLPPRQKKLYTLHP